VLHLLNAMTGWGCGIVNAALDLMSGQRSEPLEFAVCSAQGEWLPLLEKHGIRHFPLDQKRSIANLGRAISSFRRVVDTFQPDIVHSHMITGTLLARAVQFTRPYRTVAHVHNIHQRSSLLMGLADRVIAVSDAVAKDMAAHGVPAKKIRVVRNGQLGSMRIAEPATVAPRPLLQPAIVTVAGMNHRKGIAELIAAFEQVHRSFPHAHLYLVGNGPNRQEFEVQAGSSPAREQIHFEGFQEDPVPWMKAASVFVLASRRDSFGLVLTEARQCGCAIVATNVDGIPEALEYGQAGLLVPPQNPAALASAITHLLEDREAAAHLRSSAMQNLESFHVERVAARMTDVYRELLPHLVPVSPKLLISSSVQSGAADRRPISLEHESLEGLL
jgi:glycosyltransferase involved in cell wall biosynthesis